MKFIFWFSVFMIFYTYFGYAILLWCIDVCQRIFQRKKLRYSYSESAEQEPYENLPPISFIITAYNEDARIGEKIENSLNQRYPSDKLEIIIASDCSTDKTDDIVREYTEKGVKLVRAPERKGKENAQMHAVQAATGHILVFSDVATILKANAIRQIVGNFKDPSIGCVSSEDCFIDHEGNVSGEGLYVKYEMFIRKLESRVNTLVGLSGSFFAARREVCRNWKPDLQSDFNTLLNSFKIGLKGVSDPFSVGYYKNIIDDRKEFQRKIRTVLRGISVMMQSRYLLNPFRYGLFAWQLLSHKIFRWAVPLFLILCFGTNIALLGKNYVYLLLFIIQIIFYSAAIYQFAIQIKKSNFGILKSNNSFEPKGKMVNIIDQVSRIAYYFVTVNVSILIAWIKYILGERATYWTPSKR